MNWLQKISRSRDLQSIIDKWKSMVPGLQLYIYEDADRIVVSSIIVPKPQRKQGIGSNIMQDIIDYADKFNRRIELSPGIKDEYQGTTSRNRLVRFYKRFGFRENKGRNKDYRMNETMFRNPTHVKDEQNVME